MSWIFDDFVVSCRGVKMIFGFGSWLVFLMVLRVFLEVLVSCLLCCVFFEVVMVFKEDIMNLREFMRE